MACFGLRHAGFGHELQVAAGLGAKPLAVQLVGKHQFVAAQRCDRNRRVQRFKHGGKAQVRGRQLLAHPVGLGNVGHGRDPAGLRAHGVNQGGHIQAGVKQDAVAALDAYLNAALVGLARELLVQQGGELFAVALGPIRKRGGASHQFGLTPAGHHAKRGVDIGNAALQVHGAHAGEHGVFHGAAEIGLRHERLLGLQTFAGMPPIGHQHPGGHQAQRADQPEQAATNHTQRRPVRLGPHHQIITHGGHGHGVGIGLAPPGHLPQSAFDRQANPGQYRAVDVLQRHGIAR